MTLAQAETILTCEELETKANELVKDYNALVVKYNDLNSGSMFLLVFLGVTYFFIIMNKLENIINRRMIRLRLSQRNKTK